MGACRLAFPPAPRSWDAERMGRLLYAGADVRVDPSGDGGWTAERRSTYLLRPDVSFPLSVDPNVWERAPRDLTYPVPWTPVEEVQKRAAALMPSKHRVCVAVFAAAAEDPAEEEDLRARTGADTPLAADPAWTFVGFDVADGTEISGLSNCGYGAELEVVRAAWAGRLNDRGLFRVVEDAFAFRKVTDARVPEHAPFKVYGIWIVPLSG